MKGTTLILLLLVGGLIGAFVIGPVFERATDRRIALRPCGEPQ